MYSKLFDGGTHVCWVSLLFCQRSCRLSGKENDCTESSVDVNLLCLFRPRVGFQWESGCEEYTVYT